MATNAPILSFYDEKEPIVMNVDASSKGLGAVLLQNSKPVAYGSRALTQSQQSYAQIEKETLAMVFGCKKFHHYVFGRQITIETDHKRLESIFKKPLLDAPAHLQRLLMALQKYDIKVIYKPGKEMVSDALSRLYLPEISEPLVPEIEINAINLLAYLPVSEEKQTQLQQATKEDAVLQSLQSVVLSGWPNSKESLPPGLGEYWTFRDEISSLNGLLFKSHKLIVPTTMRKEMLDKIHQPHMGIVKSKSRARDVLYWPGMTSQIEEIVSKCEKCAVHQKANPREPMVTPDLPDRPWSKVSTDLFEFQVEHYLLTLDNYSKWPEVEKLDNLGSANVISYMKKQISKYGVPDEIVSDNGPQYSSAEFHQFSKKYGFTHTTSSPYYPRGNAQAERAVQTVKNLIKKASDPHMALLAYRNTPIEAIGMSPAQMFLGRRLKTSLPTSAPLLKPGFATDVRKRLLQKQQNEKLYYDNGRCKELPPLTPGDQVVFRQKWVPATVTAKHSSPRSYVVETSCGKRYRRNRSQCKKTKASFSEHSQLDIQTGYSNPNVSSPLHQQTDVTTTMTAPVDANQTGSKVTPPSDETVTVTRSGRIVKPSQRLNDFVTS